MGLFSVLPFVQDDKKMGFALASMWFTRFMMTEKQVLREVPGVRG
jgi:hypothetical protein